MKEVMLKSLKHNTITTIILAVVCVGLVIMSIVQNIQYSKTINKTNAFYKELMLEQQPDIQEFPFKKMGKFSLSWYSPKELGKETPEQLKTSRGIVPKEGRTIAVDPNVIPYGSIIYIQDYGVFIAEDCGGHIKGNRIDVFTANYNYAMQMGKKVANVWILGKI